MTVTAGALYGQLGVLQITIRNISYTIVYSSLLAPPASKKGWSLFYRYKKLWLREVEALAQRKALCDASEFPTIYL